MFLLVFQTSCSFAVVDGRLDLKGGFGWKSWWREFVNFLLRAVIVGCRRRLEDTYVGKHFR
jgi:hypothetical protein